MKSLLTIFLAFTVAFIGCNPKEKKPSGTQTPTIQVGDTSTLPVIDTTIIEDGVAPVVADDSAPGLRKMDKGEKQKKEKVSCAFNLTKFNNRKRPREEAPGGVRGKPVKPPKPGADTEVPTLNGSGMLSNITASSITFSWPAASDNKAVTGYDVFRNGIKINSSTITSTSFVDVGLSPSTTYNYSYQAKDAAGNISALSSSISGTTLSGGGGDPQPGSENVIYLNFFGRDVSGTLWNTNGVIHADSSGLADVEINFVVNQVREHYKDYNVNVTTNKADYDAAQFGHKVEIIITESYQWYGQAGGVAYINSFFWTDGSPAWVFSLLLNYNGHNIAEAIAHEAGHTLGLRHQSDCTPEGVKTNEYSNGKVMGVSYYVPFGAWVVGTSSLSCQIQDDMAKLQAALGLRLIAYFRTKNGVLVYITQASEWVSKSEVVYLKPKEYHY